MSQQEIINEFNETAKAFDSLLDSGLSLEEMGAQYVILRQKLKDIEARSGINGIVEAARSNDSR